MKSIYVYEFTKVHGPTGYLDESFFTNKTKHKEIIRNLCAHGSRIYNRLFEQKPSLNKQEKALLIKNNKGELDNAHFYGFLLIMKRILPSDNFSEMKGSMYERIFLFVYSIFTNSSSNIPLKNVITFQKMN